ncbi:TetR/AcrR family transcriptional regulator [Nonomuraea sp. NPDC049480]|uniref:TetR/AcrR family transcriptional regulator n=1 Tax=Nonomuraea sp. NPDC049480 TaxID=3364353 RepID=UPI00378C8547
MTRVRNRRGEGARLRAEMIEAATGLLASPPEEVLSLRAVARAVGVTPQSVYLHFADKQELVYAVVERLFERLDRVLDAADGGAGTPFDRLRARCLAYCAWGLANPGHYRLLFDSPATGQMGTGYAGSPGAAVFEGMRGALEPCLSPGEDPHACAVAVWTFLHGNVVLRTGKPGFPWPGLDGLVDQVLASYRPW